MNITPVKTDAEQMLAAQFEAAAARLPGGSWVPGARGRAMRTFVASGLPHRRIEAWKYTDLRSGLKTAHPPASGVKGPLDEGVLLAALGAELARLDCIRIVIVDGLVRDIAAPAGYGLGTDLYVTRLAEALGQPDYDWMRPLLEPVEAAGGGDPVFALNLAFMTDGIVLRVVEGARLVLPIHIVSVASRSEPQSVATRNLIRIESGAHAVILESHVAPGASPCQATTVTQIDVAPGASAQHIKLVRASEHALHLGRTNVGLGEGAVYRGFQLTAGAGLLRNETHVRFSGADAKFDLSGLMLGRGNDHIDTTLVVDHSTTGCESRELFKAVLDDNARAVFQGKIVVAPQAQKTDGKQMAQALMLSENAEFDSKPELEIYADDVACGHGSTVTEIDPAMLFYLRSRGLPLVAARAMLIESFVGEALDKIEDEAVREVARGMALGWLGARMSGIEARTRP